MEGASPRASPCPSSGLSHGGTETAALPQLLLLPPWLHDGVKAVAADGDSDLLLAGSAAAAETGKRRSAATQAGLARCMKVFLSGVAEMVGKRFECSIPAAKFGHVAYIR